MKVKLSDLILDFDVYDDVPRMSYTKQQEVYDYLFEKVFELSATEETEWEDVKEELKDEIEEITDFWVKMIDYDVVND
jgi:hypothetical protein